MINATCIEKVRDKNKVIKAYVLEDSNHHRVTVTPADLKQAISDGKINIVNLQLTQSGRLMDKSTENRLASYNIMGNNDLEADAKKQAKINMIGAAPIMRGDAVVGLNDNKLTVITDSTNLIGDMVQNNNATLRITGNKALRAARYGCGVRAGTIIIENPAVMCNLTNNDLLLEAGKIIIKHPLIDIKTVDEVFKILKSVRDCGAVLRTNLYIIETNNITPDEIINQTCKILKRQKESKNVPRRAFDLAVYVWFCVCMYESTKYREELMALIADYMPELKAKFDQCMYSHDAYAWQAKNVIQKLRLYGVWN